MEIHFRSGLLVAGRNVFARLLQDKADQVDRDYQPKSDQHRHGRRPLVVATLFGSVTLDRDYYYDGNEGHCPVDAALGLEGSFTPALARLMCRSAAQQPYGAASRDLQEYGGIQVDERQIQRVVQRIGPEVEPWLEALPQSSQAAPILYASCDGTGAPMRPEELIGRKGKQPDGTAKTREVKLGALFTQHTRDEKGRPIRDHQSTSYVASFEAAEDFAKLFRAEAQRRAIAQAGQVVFLSDGALWAEEIQRQNFPGAVSILDFYHAAERVNALAKIFAPADAPAAKQQAGRWIKLLLKDQVATVIDQAKALLHTARGQNRSLAQEQTGFFQAHQQRMAYGTYRQKGFFIGSGVVEAGCKTVIGKRLKQSGMFWSQRGATSVLNFRTIHLSHRFDAFWRDRQNTAAARNDTLALTN